MDFTRPVETLIPGAPGRLLAALARVDAELPVSRLAGIAGVGRTRASAVLGTLADLGVVSRRQVGAAVLVGLERRNAAGELIARLAQLRKDVTSRLRELASALEPQPLSLVLFGSFARGDASTDSDLDILAVRPSDADDRWSAALTGFAVQAQVLTGNHVQVLDYDLADLRRRAAAGPGEAGSHFWRSVTRDALILAGADLEHLLSSDHAAR